MNKKGCSLSGPWLKRRGLGEFGELVTRKRLGPGEFKTRRVFVELLPFFKNISGSLLGIPQKRVKVSSIFGPNDCEKFRCEVWTRTHFLFLLSVHISAANEAPTTQRL